LGAEIFKKDGAKIFAYINTATAMEKKCIKEGITKGESGKLETR
jgi:hypothetical protein